MSESGPQVVVRQVTRGRPHPAASKFLDRLKRKRPAWDIARHTNKESCPLSRNEAAMEAKKLGADFFLMLDDDTIPSDNVMDWPDLDLPVIGMLTPTYRKDGGFAWNASEILDGKILQTVDTPIHDPDNPNAVLPVYLIGTAVMMIRRDVLENESLYPLFEYDLYPDGTRRPYGAEDHFFCRKLWDCGIPVHMATCLARHFVEMDAMEILTSINAHVVGQNVRPPYLFQSMLSEYSFQDGKPFDKIGPANYLDFCNKFKSAVLPKMGKGDGQSTMARSSIQERIGNVSRGLHVKA